MCGFEVLVGRLGGEIIDIGRPVKTVGQAAKYVGSGLRQIVKSLVFVLEEGWIILFVSFSIFLAVFRASSASLASVNIGG